MGINTDKSNGSVTFGLFEYQSVLNSGLGDRVEYHEMLDILYKERTFLIYELYIATIATVCGGIFFGIISAMMAIVNTASNPIEAICHIPGLYLWNGIALCSSTASVVTWMVQFYLRLTHNLLIREYRTQGNWSSEGMASFGFSFWMVVIAAVIFLANNLVTQCSTRDSTQVESINNHFEKVPTSRRLNQLHGLLEVFPCVFAMFYVQKISVKLFQQVTIVNNTTKDFVFL